MVPLTTPGRISTAGPDHVMLGIAAATVAGRARTPKGTPARLGSTASPPRRDTTLTALHTTSAGKIGNGPSASSSEDATPAPPPPPDVVPPEEPTLGPVWSAVRSVRPAQPGAGIRPSTATSVLARSMDEY